MDSPSKKPLFHYRELFHNVIACDMTLAVVDGHPMSLFSSNPDRVTCQQCLRIAAHALNKFAN